MKHFAKVITLLIACAFCFSLTGCGDEFTSEDAEIIVKGNIDCIYLNTYDQEFLDLCDTTAKECDAVYNEYIKEVKDDFITIFAFQEEYFDEELVNRLFDICVELSKKVKYEVGTATENNDVFQVPVTVYPMDILVQLINEDLTALYNEAENLAYSGATEEEVIASIMDAYLTLFEEDIENVQYLDPITIDVQVMQEQQEDGSFAYIVDENDINEIDKVLLSTDY
jgi:hypothetical protein